MLSAIDGGKYKSLDALVDATVPKAIRLPKVRRGVRRLRPHTCANELLRATY